MLPESKTWAPIQGESDIWTGRGQKSFTRCVDRLNLRDCFATRNYPMPTECRIEFVEVSLAGLALLLYGPQKIRIPPFVAKVILHACLSASCLYLGERISMWLGIVRIRCASLNWASFQSRGWRYCGIIGIDPLGRQLQSKDPGQEVVGCVAFMLIEDGLGRSVCPTERISWLN